MAVENISDLAAKLRGYKREDIVITDHALFRAELRGISIEEVKKNLLNPERLKFAESSDGRCRCYFGYSNSLAHEYVVILNGKIIVVTVIKIKRKWQRGLEKHAKIHS